MNEEWGHFQCNYTTKSGMCLLVCGGGEGEGDRQREEGWEGGWSWEGRQQEKLSESQKVSR